MPVRRPARPRRGLEVGEPGPHSQPHTQGHRASPHKTQSHLQEAPNDSYMHITIESMFRPKYQPTVLSHSGVRSSVQHG